MNQMQIALPVALVLVLIILLYITLRLQRARLGRQDAGTVKPRRGGPNIARARLTDVQGGIPEPGSGRALFHLKMIVETLDGRKYPAAAVWLVEASAFHFMQVGQVLTVQVNSGDSSLIRPNAPWASDEAQK